MQPAIAEEEDEEEGRMTETSEDRSADAGDRASTGRRRERVPLDELEPERRDLVEAARGARNNAHAPFSGFPVGAAVRDSAGAVHVGCNVEVSTYGLTLCAERVALFAARAAGVRSFAAVAIAGPASSGATPPCGACRQVIWELAGDVEVLLVDGEAVEVWRAGDLLPNAFGPERLEEIP